MISFHRDDVYAEDRERVFIAFTQAMGDYSPGQELLITNYFVFFYQSQSSTPLMQCQRKCVAMHREPFGYGAGWG